MISKELMQELNLHEFLKQKNQDRIISVRESQLRNYVNQMKAWSDLAEWQQKEIAGLRELTNAQRLQLEERKSVLVNLGV